MSLKDLIKKAAEGDSAALGELEKLQERNGYLESELEKAIKARDGRKSELTQQEREELDQLRAKSVEAEEAQLKAKGDYDALQKRLEAKVAKAEADAKRADERLAEKAIDAAFANATDLFGPKGRTILTPDFAKAGFRANVKFVPSETGDDGSVVVHDLKGEAIVGSDGKPATFAEAMGRLIDTWPTKSAILRGGGKAGSGSAGSGESTGTSATRAEIITRAAAGDPEARAALAKAPSPGQQVSGMHWERQAQKANEAAKPA